MTSARRRPGAIIGATLVAVALVMAVWGVLRNPEEALDLQVLEPPATTLAELVARADAVVVGRVVRVEAGRTISAPGDPDRTVRTQLAAVAVDEQSLGATPDTVILEEVVALGDGTPVTVGGLRASQVGDAGLYLVVAGEEGRWGLIGPQGRYLLTEDGQGLSTGSDDPLARTLAALTPAQLRAQIRDR